MLAQLDVRVTIVELLDDILSFLDGDVRGEVRRHMERALGIRIFTGKTIEDIAADDHGIRGAVGEQKVEADLLLAALGRRPVTEELRLENAGLSTGSQGFIEVDEYCRTQVATIYAIGDVTGGTQLAHAATSQGLVAAENACTRGLRKNEKYVPYCIFTSPEVAAIGLSEQQARNNGVEVKVGKLTLAAVGKSLAIGHPYGFVKLIADTQTGQLLGAQAVGEHATELIAEATSAIRSELTAEELAHTIHAHPTLSEAWAESAHVLEGKPLHSGPTRSH
jgi:dihydrolipoamide dehydrogenase